MAINLPKLRVTNTSVKMPKLAMAGLKLVATPKIGYAKSNLPNLVKIKMKLK